MADFSDESQQLQRLLTQAVHGRDGVDDELIVCAEQRLYALAQRMLNGYPRLRRWEQTDDIFQSAALRLHRSLTDVRPKNVAEFMGLAATQIRRTLIDLARHHFGSEGKHTRHHSDADGIAIANQPETHGHGSAEEPATLEQWLRFHEGVESLPSDERQVFEAIWYGNLTQKQVGELYGLSASTVKRRMRSVRLRLGELLEEEAINQ